MKTKTVANHLQFGVRAATLCLLAAAALLLPGEARAQWTTSGASTTTTNNVGVGTTAPQSNLHVSTASIATGTRGIIDEQTSNDGNGALLVVRKSRAGAAVQTGDYIGNLYASAFDGTNWVSGSRVRFYVDGPVSAGVMPTAIQFITGTDNSAVERARITSAGNFGIGTAAPTFLLDVSGSTNTPFRVRDSTGREYLSTTTHVGTYGTAPVVSLAGSRLIIDTDGPDGSNNTLIRRAVNSMVIRPSEHPTLPGGFFVQQVGGVYGLFVDQQANGNVGIGTSTPASKLHVAGNITVDGNINAKYQDVAEWVPSTQKLAVGTVVIIDADGINHVSASTAAYATSVAGVITGQPGLLLGEEGEGKVKVATTGRVKVKVDATRAPIKAGDLLVTSETPGVAMRSEPVSVGGVAMHRPGTLIGKALEPLAKGTGEILVLLSLQ